MQRYFFRRKTTSDLHEPTNQECCIQIPSLKDMEQMKRMPAGSTEDQRDRLKHMTQVLKEIQSHNPSLPLTDTEQVSLPPCWNQLFVAMHTSQTEVALTLFRQIPQKDTLLQALLRVHSQDYLQEIILYCIQAQKEGWKQLNPDILITPGAFEVLMKDLAMSLFHSGKVLFSFGLPSHHAYAEEGSGFCILNKTAILIRHAESMSSQPLKYIIVGTDVNRDNGLCDILMTLGQTMDLCHVDIFDSRVYPYQDHAFVAQAYKQTGKDVGQKIQVWQQGSLEYFAVDLSMTTRKAGTVHPALVFAIQKIEEQIKEAKVSHQKVALFLPTGWDSHKNETAYCGKCVDGRMMSSVEAKKMRFNDTDLIYFYENIFKLYQENKAHIERVYWGLEGGYDRTMYEQEIQLLMSLVLENLVAQDTNHLKADATSLKS